MGFKDSEERTETIIKMVRKKIIPIKSKYGVFIVLDNENIAKEMRLIHIIGRINRVLWGL